MGINFDGQWFLDFSIEFRGEFIHQFPVELPAENLISFTKNIKFLLSSSQKKLTHNSKKTTRWISISCFLQVKNFESHYVDNKTPHHIQILSLSPLISLLSSNTSCTIEDYSKTEIPWGNLLSLTEMLEAGRIWGFCVEKKIIIVGSWKIEML